VMKPKPSSFHLGALWGASCGWEEERTWWGRAAGREDGPCGTWDEIPKFQTVFYTGWVLLVASGRNAGVARPPCPQEEK